MKKLYKKYQDMPIQVKAAFWFTVCNILQKGISFLTVPIYTRLLSTEQYGVYTVFLSWLEIFEIIATFRISWGGYSVGLAKYEDDRDAYTSSLQCLSILITTVCFVICLLFENQIYALTGMSREMLLLMFMILYAMPAIQFWTVRKRTENKYLSVISVTVASSLFTVLCGSLAALRFEQKDLAVIGGRALIQGFLGCVLIWVNCRGNFTIYRAEYWKRTIRFNVPLLPYYLSTVVLHSSDKIIIQNLVGQIQAGIYGVAYTASACMQLFSSSLNQALQPWLYAKLNKKETKGIARIINVTLCMIAVLNLILIALAPEAVKILAPGQYHEAVWVIPPLAASVVVMFFYQHFVNVEFFYEESRLTAIASVGAAVLNVILNYWLIPVFGYFAAGYTTLASYLIFGIAHYIFMRIVCRKHNVPDDIVDIKSMVLILVGFLMVTAVLMAGYIITPIRYGFIILTAVILIASRKKLMLVARELLEGRKGKKGNRNEG